MNEWFWVWVTLAVVLSVAEIFTGGFFLLPFGIGAAVAAAIEFFWPGSIGWQWVAFLGVSSVMLIALRRIVDHTTHEPPVKMGAQRLVGMTGIVTETLKPHSPEGRVRVDREEWRAETEDDETEVVQGTRVEVIAIDGTHLVVKPVEGSAS